MKYSNHDEFQQATGLIDDDEKLKEIGVTAFVGESSDGSFETDLLSKLKAFCVINPAYHIATMTSDSDESESSECERRAAAQNLNWERMTDDEREEFRQKEEIFATTIDNKIRFVNRMSFFLCVGDADPDLFLEDVND